MISSFISIIIIYILIYRYIRLQDNSVQLCTHQWSIQSYFESAILNIVQKGNIEGFSFGYFMFYYWHALIHILAKYSCHSLQRLDLAGLGPTIFNEESRVTCFNSTYNSMASLINLKVICFSYNKYYVLFINNILFF